MAKKADIGATIGIDGEKQFKAQITSINEALRTSQTEMKLVTSAYAANEQSTEALTEKNAVLENSVESLTQKLKLQSEQVAKLQQAYGETDSRTQRAYQAYNRTKTELNNVSAAIEKNNAQIQYNSSLFGKLGISVEDVGRKLGLTSGATNKLTFAFGSLAVKCALYVVVTAKLVSELVKLSDAAARHADQVDTMATKYNMSAQSIQQFEYMAELTDVSVETITGSIAKLTRNMDSARDGTGSAAEAFASLGVSVTNSDGTLRSANDVFAESIDALGRVGNETERDALAMDIFGTSAMELNPLIKQGSEGLRELADEAANSGYVMSDKMTARLTEADDATQRLEKAMDGLKNTLGAGVAPAVAFVRDTITDFVNGSEDLFRWFFRLEDDADAAAAAVNRVSTSIAGLKDLTAKDLMSQSQKDYVQYLNTMGDYYKSLGLSSGYVQDYGLWSENQQRMRSGERVVYDSARSINVTLELDSQTIARGTYDANRAEASRIGNHAVR